jgi:thioredoxin 1
MNKSIFYADSQSFQTMIESNILVFVDFYADWCGPCKTIAPSIERLAEEYNGTVKFVKLNIDTSPHIARKYGVKSIPTLMIFRDGKQFRRMVGASPLGHYRGELQKVVSKTQIGTNNVGKL